MRESWIITLSAFLAVAALSLPASSTPALASSPRTTPRIGTQVAELKCADTVAGDQFGNSLGISGTTAIVGAPQHANGGEACAFTEWLGNANLKGSDTVAGDSFGSDRKSTRLNSSHLG